MSQDTAVRIFCGMWGAALGAAAQGVEWTFWASWGIGWGAVILIAYWHRSDHVPA